MEKSHDKPYERVLALYPNHRGYGYALFEGPRELVAWGLKTLRSHKNARSLDNIRAQIDLYEPDVLVIEDYEGEGSRREQRVRELLDSIEGLTHEHSFEVCKYSRSEIRKVFEFFGATTKQEIASFIAASSPSNELEMPEVRKPWMCERYKMGVFDAIAFGLTHYYLKH